MKKFMAMYMAPAATIRKMMATTTPEQAKAGMDEWMKWSKAHEKAVVDLGMPLGKTKSVGVSGISDTSNDMTGYSIVEAESLEAAAAMFKDHPHLMMEGATVDVLECMDMSEMMGM